MGEQPKSTNYVLIAIVVLIVLIGGYRIVTWDSEDTGSNNEIGVSDQAPGAAVTVSTLTLNDAAWIVIHADNAGKPGDIIATKQFEEGTYINQEIDLGPAATEGGKIYYAMIHRDDGDDTFDPTKDTPITGENNNPLMSKFVIKSQAAPAPAPAPQPAP